jgi:hypothetical protein
MEPLKSRYASHEDPDRYRGPQDVSEPVAGNNVPAQGSADERGYRNQRKTRRR